MNLKEFRLWVVRLSQSASVQYVPAFIIPAVLALVGSAIFTRMLTPEDYGLLALISSFTGPILISLNQGLAQPVGRYYWEYYNTNRGEEFSRAVGSVMVQSTYLVAGVVAIVFLGFAMTELPKGLTWAMLAGAAINFWAASVTPVMMRQLQSGFRISTYRRLHIVGSLLSLGIPLLLMVLFGASVVWMIWGASCASVTILVWVSRVTKTNLWMSPHALFRLAGPTLAIRARLLRFGFPLIPWYLLVALLRTSDRYALAMFRGTGPVGVYNTAYILVAESVGILMRMVMAAQWPQMAADWSDGLKDKVVIDIGRVTNVLIIVGIAVIGTEGTFGVLAFHLLLGRKFMSGQVILVPVLIAMVIWGICDVGHKLFELSSRPGLLIIPAVAALVVNIGMNLLLAPRWGIVAVAWDTLFAFVVYGLGVWALSLRVLPWPISWAKVGYFSMAALVAWPISYRLIGNPRDSIALSILQGGIYLSIYVVFVLTIWKTQLSRSGQFRLVTKGDSADLHAPQG